MLASLVLLEHTFVLAGLPKPGHMYARLAVGGFFFLSGLLITQSFVHARSFWDYMWRRTLRIFPGFWACLIVTAFVIVPVGWIFLHGSLSGYLSGPESPLSFVARGAPMYGMHQSIRDVFAVNPEGNVANGSLWTLPVEYLCYIGLGVLGVIGVVKRRPWLIVVGFALVYFWHVFPSLRLPEVRGIQLPTKFTDTYCLELYAYFALGSALFLFRDRVKIRTVPALVALGLVIFLIAFESLSPEFQTFSRAVRVIALPYGLLWLARWLPLPHFDRKRDISYGVYIYGYPIQQVLVLAGAAAWGGWALFAVAYLLTVGFAVLSWHFIEQPALRLKRMFAAKGRRMGDEAISTDPDPILVDAGS